MKHLKPLERKSADVSGAPGGVLRVAASLRHGLERRSFPLPAFRVPRVAGHDHDEAQLVTELQKCHRQGVSGVTGLRPPCRTVLVVVPCPRGLLLSFPGGILAKVFPSLVFIISLKIQGLPWWSSG